MGANWKIIDIVLTNIGGDKRTKQTFEISQEQQVRKWRGYISMENRDYPIIMGTKKME